MNSAGAWDVVVVGGGLAGLCAAGRAAELGLKAVVLERGSEAHYPCNSRYSGGILHIAQHNVQEPADQLLKVIDAATLGQCDPALARTLAEDARRALDWLRAEGAKFIRVGQIVWQQHVLAPPRPIAPGLDWKGRGSDVMLRTLEANLVKRGGALLRGTAARALMQADGRCSGVEAEAGGKAVRFDAKAIVLADGGYQANGELLGEYITPAPTKLKQRGAATGTGDALRMARALGAAVTALDAFYGHILSRDAFANDKTWPYPQLDELGTAGIVVDGRGERFTDEGMGGVHVANQIARLDDPLSTWAVFDDVIWNGPGKAARIPANPHLVQAGATVHQAPTLAGLAEVMSIPAARFEATIASYNKAFAAGRLEMLTPRRSSTRIAAMALTQAPYRAVPLCAGITYTMGGLATDSDGQVLRAGGGAIDGLYAVGAASGGLEGGSGAGYVGGLIKAATFGLRAGERIARALRDY